MNIRHRSFAQRSRPGSHPHRRAAVFQSLEGRQLLAAPAVSGMNYAAFDDSYAMSISLTNGGSTIPNNSSVTSISWSVAYPWAFDSAPGAPAPRTTFSAFEITRPSDASSVQFFSWLNSNTRMEHVTIVSRDSGNRVRTTYDLSKAYVTGFSQDRAPDGDWQDHVRFAITEMNMTFSRYHANGSLLDSSTASWNIAANSGSPATSAFDNGTVATSDSVVETIEWGAGQLPIGDSRLDFVNSTSFSSASGGLQFGVVDASALTYSAVDGREGLSMFGYITHGQHSENVIYSRKTPSTGNAMQRYQLGNVYPTRYAIYDSVFDTTPRVASYSVLASKYKLVNYTYSGANGAIQASTSFGWNYAINSEWNFATNSAHTESPADEPRNTPLNSVTFHFMAPVSLALSSFSFEGLNTSGLSLTPTDAGKTWTISNLSPQQTADGHYSVNLLADRINDLETTSSQGGLFIGSAGKSWTLDTGAPGLIDAGFDFDGPPNTPYAFDFALSEPVIATANDGTAPVLIRRIDNGALVATALATVQADGVSLHATLPAILADGRYRATLPSGSVRDPAGNLLSSDVNFNFFVLAGDADHNATVDFADLLTLAQHYGQDGQSFSAGNFNYSADGRVDFSDLLILAQRYGTSLTIATAAGLSRSKEGRGGVAAILQ